VAAVDASDKAKAYANWARVMSGDMRVTIGDSVRSLRDDIHFRTPEGSMRSVPGRVLSLIRNVGIHCKTNIILHEDGTEVYEGLVDAVVSVVAGLRDLRSGGSSHGRVNSRAGSIYVVKPKLHGPEEVKFACCVFAHIENILGLPLNTVKIGIMDEERRTSVNLRACIDVAQQRVFFINTGFLDRTGDEIHTCMRGGPVLPKSMIKSAKWILAYERLNVINGVAAGFLGRAQIGKGMWAEPDSMRAMMEQKIVHPKSAASTAWVPSPTAATLHAIHYHQVNVRATQRTVDTNSVVSGLEADLLVPPLMNKEEMQKLLNPNLIRQELLNNAQGVLGYVVRWVDQGIGCSKVPDIRNVGLMEDLATLRISSQHIANWLLHGLVSEKHVMDAFSEMALTVDNQNSKDPKYVAMSGDLKNNPAFNVALQLVKQGTKLPNGYSIGLLVEARRKKKTANLARSAL
jgi:malate synthase